MQFLEFSKKFTGLDFGRLEAGGPGDSGDCANDSGHVPKGSTLALRRCENEKQG